MSLPPLPVTVVSGYLGAGKTSLINHLLTHAEGRRIMVMVNDFGDLDIDARLLVSADEDTMVLSNGCICCTMGAELLYALSDTLDRRPRPDWLVIEASGVAEPAKIAAAAHAEPEMRYQGVVSLADAAHIAALLADPMIGAQVAAQITAADLILLTKTDLAPAGPAEAALRALSAAPILAAERGAAPIDLLADRAPGAPEVGHGHDHGADYRRWSATGGVVERAALLNFLKSAPGGFYRLKGHVRLAEGGAVEAHVVGGAYELVAAAEQDTALVAIGLAARFDAEACEQAWRALIT